MKIGVLTFHRCINYGSYWQARCLVEGLIAMGHDAVLMDHDAGYIRAREWRCAFQPLLPVRSAAGDIRRYGVKARAFLRAFDALPQSARFPLDEPELAERFDAVVVGSDEVWNFAHPWYGYKPVFWGEGLGPARLVAYAASFGNYAEAAIPAGWAEKLARFDAIAVRDANGRRLVRGATGREPAVVLDPCLQFPPPAPAPSDEGAPYVLVYGHNFPDWLGERVRGWAEAAGKRVVSVGYRVDWADTQRIEAGPDAFASLVAGADAVVTNFFHGCVFALLHAKPFVTAPSAYRSNKVHDLVAKLGAERHLIDAGTDAAGFAALLETPIDPAVGAAIAGLRAEGTAFLEAALG